MTKNSPNKQYLSNSPASPFSGKPDHLSYSYSCIQAFKENQNILNDLIKVRPKQKCSSILEDPLLYSLSGEREHPIYHPFYYSFSTPEYLGAGENYGSGKSKNIYGSSENILELKSDDKGLNGESSSEKLYVDNNLVFQWIKYQFKYVNYLWPFLKSKEFIPSLCKKSKEIKMEMLLNNINENSKSSLKKYVEQLKLNVEEKCSITNESVYEIDITPIVGDKQRLREFLEFLHSIESASSKSNKIQESKENIPNSPLKSQMNEFLTSYDKGDFFNKNSNLKTSYDKLRKGINYTRNQATLKQNIQLKDNKVNMHGMGDNKTLTRNSNNRQNEISPKPTRKEETRTDMFETRNSTLRKDFSKFPSINKNPTSDTKLFTTIDHFNMVPKDIQVHEKNKFNDKEKGMFEKTNSCKCIIHQCREDYRRYKNQCLFGKGDEKSNNFIGYVKLKEQESRLNLNKCKSDTSVDIERSKCKYCNRLNNFKKCSKTLQHNDVSKPKFIKKIPISKHINPLRNTQDKNVHNEESSGSNITDICFHNCQSVRAEDSEEEICRVNYSNADINKKLQKQSVYTQYKNANAVNACFDSLNYSLNSPSWTTISEQISESLTFYSSHNSSDKINLVENSSPEQGFALETRTQIPKQTKVNSLKNITRQRNNKEVKTPLSLNPKYVNKNNRVQVYCEDKIENKYAQPPGTGRKDKHSNRFVNVLYEKNVVLEDMKSFETKLDSAKPNKKLSRLSVLKPKNLYKSVSAIIKGNNNSKLNIHKKSTDYSIYESSEQEFNLENTDTPINHSASHRVPSMTRSQQNEITSMIIESLEKVYKELKQQNSDIVNLKRILYDRVFEE